MMVEQALVEALKQFPIALVILWLGERQGRRLDDMHGRHLASLEAVSRAALATTQELQGDLAERGRALAGGIVEEFRETRAEIVALRAELAAYVAMKAPEGG